MFISGSGLSGLSWITGR